MEWVQEFINRLQRLGVWPRPPGIPWPQLGEDYAWPDIENLPSFERACQSLWEHEWLRPMYTHGPEHPAHDFRFVLQPFAERVVAYVALGYSFPRAFDRWYRTFLAELRRPQLTILRIHAIPSFNCDLPRVPLDAKSCLVQIGGFRTRRLLMLDAQAPVRDISEYEPRGWALATVYRVQKRGSRFSWNRPPYEDHNRLDSLLSSLRLLHPGEYLEGLDAEAHLSLLPFDNVMVYREHPVLHREGEHKITGRDIPAIRRLFKYLLRVNSFDPLGSRVLPQRLSQALFHFNRSVEDRGWMNVAMELVIALEILLGVSEEAKFRLATRVALLVGGDDEDTKRLFRQVGELYDARSIPAHGRTVTAERWRKFYRAIMGEAPPTIEPGMMSELKLIDDATEAGRDVVRRVILACLRLQQVRDERFSWPFGKALDEILLTSGRQTIQRLGRAREGISF